MRSAQAPVALQRSARLRPEWKDPVTVTPSAHRDLIGTHVEIGEPYPHISATRMPVSMNSRTMDSSRRPAKSFPWHALTSA
jgi:hypothetical protein